MKRTLLVIALAALLTVGCNAQNESQNEVKVVERPVQQPLPSLVTQTDFTEVAARTIDAVVHIKTEMTKLTPLYQSFFGMIIDRGVRRQTYNAFGSGVIISSDGYIVTNNHVVQDAEKLTVTLNDKRELPARIVGIDPATDLAVIKIQANNLQFIPFGNSDSARIGEPVLAIGNPFNLTSTVTAGIISAKARYMNIINNPGVESTIESFIQTDAAVNSGNSGGALVNGRAELIGINTAMMDSSVAENMGLAIPISDVTGEVESMMNQETRETVSDNERGYLGINIVDVTSEISETYGLPEGIYVSNVAHGSGAEAAGIEKENIITGINGRTIKTSEELTDLLSKYKKGETVTVTIAYRTDNGYETKDVEVTLGNSPT